MARGKIRQAGEGRVDRMSAEQARANQLAKLQDMSRLIMGTESFGNVDTGELPKSTGDVTLEGQRKNADGTVTQKTVEHKLGLPGMPGWRGTMFHPEGRPGFPGSSVAGPPDPRQMIAGGPRDASGARITQPAFATPESGVDAMGIRIANEEEEKRKTLEGLMMPDFLSKAAAGRELDPLKGRSPEMSMSIGRAAADKGWDISGADAIVGNTVGGPVRSYIDESIIKNRPETGEAAPAAEEPKAPSKKQQDRQRNTAAQTKRATAAREKKLDAEG